MSTATITKTKPEIKPQAAPAKPEKPKALKTPVDVFYLLTSSGSFTWIIHKTDCKRYNADKQRSQYKGLDDYGLEGVLNQRDVIMEVWDDQIVETFNAEEHGEDEDYAGVSWAWLTRNGYTGSVQFHTCLDGLAQSASKTKASSETIKKATKNELATRVIEAAAALLDELFSETLTEEDDEPGDEVRALIEFRENLLTAFGTEEAARQCVAQWLHGMPADRDRWFASGMPIPNRSDWADYQPPAESETDTAKDAE